MIQSFTRPHTLTIYVMAYENGDLVRSILSSLLPFQNADVCIVVADNSDKTNGVMCAVTDMVPQLGGRLAHHRFETNLGQQGSILRAFELVKSPYLWIVGAGNFFLPGCLETALAILKDRRPDVMMHSEQNLWRRFPASLEEREYSSAIDMIRDHSHSVACSINSMIYSTTAMLPLLRVGYETASCLSPHAAMLYEGMRTGALKVSYFPVELIHRPNRPRLHWTMRQYLRGLPMLFPGNVPEAEMDAFFAELRLTDEWIFWEPSVHEVAERKAG